MRKLHSLRLISVPVLAAMLTAPMLSGCGESSDLTDGGLAGECEAELSAKANAFEVSVNALVDAAAELKASLAVACYNIANGLGDETVTDPGDGMDLEDDEMTTLCDAASAAISAEVTASGSITLEYDPPRCEVNASAQLSCGCTGSGPQIAFFT